MIFLLSAAGLRADNDVWTGGAPGSPSWSNTLNWLPHSPSGGDSLLFAASTKTNPQVDTVYSVGSITFAPAAPAYTVNVTLGASITINGTGVTNNSTSVQTFDAAGSDGNTAAGGVLFTGTAAAGNAAFINNPSTLYGSDGSSTTFMNNTTAGTATFTSYGPSAINARAGNVYFQDNATAANAIFNNSGGNNNRLKGGNLFLSGSATAANAVIVNSGALGEGGLGGLVTFSGSATAGNATITCNGTGINYGDGGQAYFIQSASAANATMTANGGLAVGGDGGFVYFNDNSTAGNATITCNGSAVAGVDGGYLYFFGASTGGMARAILNTGGFLDISSISSLRGISIGSIEGAGTVLLGSKLLLPGANNASTTLSGTVQDGGYSGGTGGSVNKVGTGTLTLSGTSTYTGTTMVSAGALVISGSAANTRSVAVSGGTTLSLGGTGVVGQASTTVAISAGGTLSGGGTLNGVVTNNGTITVDGSTLALTGSMVNNGTIRLAGGARLNASGTGSFVNNGVLDLLDGAANLPPNFTNGPGGVVVDMSTVRVNNVGRSGTLVTLTLNGYTGHTYQLERADSAGGPYTNVETAQSGNAGNALTFTYQESSTAKQGFYRVQVDQGRTAGNNGAGAHGQDNVGRARLNPVYPGKVRRQPAQ